MELKQVYEFTNLGVTEALGKSDILKEDLSNIVEVGDEVFNAKSVDKYVQSLVDHIGKVLFVDRTYRSHAPSVLIDGWEYGATREKIHSPMPTAIINEAWELQDGAAYVGQVFNKPVVTAKFYNQRDTFRVDTPSITRDQVKSAFSNASQMEQFISRLFNRTRNAITLRRDKMIMGTIASAVASTYHADIGGKDATKTSGVKAINLLKLYNDAKGTTLTKDKALYDTEFLKFASLQIALASDHRETYSTLFNIGGTEKFTDKNRQHIVLLSNFKRGADVYLQSETFHNEFTKLPTSEGVNFWQGSGKNYNLADVAKINCKDAEGDDVTIDCLIGCIFDRDRLGVCCQQSKITSEYSATGDFYNYYNFFTAGYFNDLNENMVIFFLA